MPACTRSIGALVFGTVLLGACGTTGDTPARLDATSISWRIDVGTQSDVPFGARVLINGEQVYVEASPKQLSHRVDVVRPYVAGEHILEVEIVSSSKSPAVFAASCTAQVKPNGRIVHADGIPWTLGNGERLFLKVSL
jgi:hypothetical protein